MRNYPRSVGDTVRRIAGLFVAVLLAACVHSAPQTRRPDTPPFSAAQSPATRLGYRLIAIDVFGNRTVPVATLRELIPLDEGSLVTLEGILALLRPEEHATATDQLPQGVPEESRLGFALHVLGERIERQALEHVPITFAEFSQITGGDRTMTLVLDVAERGDPGLSGFRSVREENVLLPDALGQVWEGYRDLIFSALRGGNPVQETMESGHWRTLDPRTRAAEEQFFVLVRDHLSAIRAGALRHRDPNIRQMCAYLLTWSPDPLLAVQTLLEAIRDPVGYVRNEAARALIPLAALSVEAQQLDVPVEPIIDLLNRPTATDRNKAAAILLQLAVDPSRRTTIRARAGKRLEAMASSRAPLNHDVAVRVLALLGDSR